MEVPDAASPESSDRAYAHKDHRSYVYICDEIEWGVKCSKPFTSLRLFKARIRTLGTL